MTLRSRYVCLMSLCTAMTILISAPPVVNFSACLVLGIMAGMLYGKKPSLFFWGCVSVTIGFAADRLSGVPDEDFDDTVFRILVVVTLSLLLFLIGYPTGKWMIRKLREWDHRKELLREIDAEYPARLFETSTTSPFARDDS